MKKLVAYKKISGLLVFLTVSVESATNMPIIDLQ